MDIKRGIAVSPGVAIGPALLLDTEWFRIPQRFIEAEQIADEIDRLHQALQKAAAEVEDSQRAVSDKLGRQYGAIFGAHVMLIQDPTLTEEVEALIRDQNYAAEYAVSRVWRDRAKMLESIGDGRFSSRAADLFDVEKNILRNLLGHRREQ